MRVVSKLIDPIGAGEPWLVSNPQEGGSAASGTVSGAPPRLSGSGYLISLKRASTHFSRAVPAESAPQRHRLAENL
jgi:hypothetical protein